MIRTALILAALALPVATSQAGTPVPYAQNFQTATRFQEQQINALKLRVRNLEADLRCFQGHPLGVVQITGDDGTPWLAVAGDQDAAIVVYVPTVNANCLTEVAS